MLAVNSSNTVEIILTNPLSGFVNNANITVVITDSAGVELPSEIWPQSVDYVADSDGIYRKTFVELTDLVENKLYTVIFNAVGIDTLKLEVKKVEKAVSKTCC